MSSGGKGNSKSQTNATTSTTTSQTTINTVDNRAAQGDGAIFGGNVTVNSGDAASVNITATDLGAIKGGLDLAFESLNAFKVGSANSIAALQSVASDSIGQAYGLANSARQSETSGAINALVKYLFWIALAGVIVYGVKKSSK